MARDISNSKVPRPSSQQFDIALKRGSQVCLIILGVSVAICAAQLAKPLLAPFALALVVGLMFGPVADRIERWGVPSSLSAAAVVFLFIIIIATAFFGIAIPMSEWVRKLPEIWSKLQVEVYKWKGTLAAVESVQSAVRGLGATGDKMVVTVDDGSAVQSAAFLAPAVFAQIGLFLVGMYFLLATRRQIQLTLLSFALTRRVRIRIARIFGGVEQVVSRYLLSITFINLGLGLVVAAAMWVLGMPSPLLWGGLAFVFNYVVFIGTAALSVMLFVVALGSMDSPVAALLPVVTYLFINFVEAQFVTPNLLGRMLTLNPLLVFVSVTFWIWLWGPVGGFVAVPFLLIFVVILRQFGFVRPVNGASGANSADVLDRGRRRTY